MFESLKANYKKTFNSLMGTAQKMMNNDHGDLAPFAIIGAVVAFAIGLGVCAMVLVLMPAISGQVIDAINVTADNPFYNLTQDVPSQITGSYSLLYVAIIVGVAALIISIVLGIFMFFRQ
jgi:quinol-cytochrome oxidoreductase complex cytochrome b subunit